MPRLDHKAVPGIETVYSLNLGELSEQPKLDCPEPNRTIRRKMLRTAFAHYGDQQLDRLGAEMPCNKQPVSERVRRGPSS